MITVDLNCDMGESFGAWRMGDDGEVLRSVTSANIACGFHAGDPQVMRSTIGMALTAGVSVGAHPGLPDLAGFGRRTMQVTAAEVHDMVVYQLGALDAFMRVVRRRLTHVKPHGALYNMAAADRELAAAIARAVQEYDPGLVLFGLAGSQLVTAGRMAGLRVASEVFADRNYMPDGSLVPRSHPEAKIHWADDAVERAVRMVRDRVVTAIDGSVIEVEPDTICVHGDGPSASAIASGLYRGLVAAGIQPRAIERADA
jgi:5-oxoprolinase (ATP-hydrolysing) subunit A